MNKLSKNRISATINAAKFEADEKGKITFKKPLVITDNNEQWNGTKYDIESMDVSAFGNKLTANHSNKIQEVIGKVFGTKKENNKVTIDGIELAVEENALSLFAFNMLKKGLLTDFSIETVGPWPDEEGVYKNSSLVGLSLVVVGNNKKAKINEAEMNEVAINSISEAKELGLDSSIVENNFLCYDKNAENKINNKKENDMKFVTIKNSKKFAVEVKFKNAAGDEVEKELKPGETVDVSDDQAEEVNKQVEESKEPKTEEVKKEEEVKPENNLNEIVANALKPVVEKMAKLEESIFDNNVKEPEFRKEESKKSMNKLDSMNYKQRHGLQIQHAWNWLQGNSNEAHDKLIEINKIHLEKLQEADLVPNSITIADMGNFVISPELLTDIEGFRSNYRPLLEKVNFQETLSLQMAWLDRNGDIDMEEVEHCDDGADGNLKPISEYAAEMKLSNLHELAAVTPVCNAATRFLAADLLGDVAQGYRTDFDRKKAQLLIARLQQAVNTTGNSFVYSKTTDTTALQSWVQMWGALTEEVENGYFILSYKSKAQLIQDVIGAGIAGPLATTLLTGDLSPILGEQYIVVPNDLMPTLNTDETKTFTVEGVSVTINKGVFFADLSTFTGRTSGGLQYDLSTQAAYEDNGTVKSAFQRNELLLRGSFFRGGAIKDASRVAALGAAGVS